MYVRQNLKKKKLQTSLFPMFLIFNCKNSLIKTKFWALVEEIKKKKTLELLQMVLMFLIGAQQFHYLYSSQLIKV